VSAPATVSIDTIKRLTAATWGVSLNDLVSQRRDGPTVRARHVAIYLARQMTPYSLPQIAFHFGKRDHTTIMHAVKRIEVAMDMDGHLASVVAGLWHSMLPARVRGAA
jgi:chromosomal replication initiator protein